MFKYALPRIFLFLLSLILSASTCWASRETEPEIAFIRMGAIDTFPPARMKTEVFLPLGTGPFPVLIFAHGRPSNRYDRSVLSDPVPFVHVKYWLKHGFAVVAPIRPGYGATGGLDREGSGAAINNDLKQCHSAGDLVPFMQRGMAALRSTLDWVKQQTWAKPKAIVLEGHGAGGFLVTALAAENPDGVVGFINFAGGAASFPESGISYSCADKQLTQIFSQAGQTMRAPSIWLYAENDGFWGPDAPKKWHAAFAKDLRVPSEFIFTGPLPNFDGHYLLNYGGVLWAESVNRFVERLQLRE